MQKISDTLLVESCEKVLLNKNPYIDREYFQHRQERKSIAGATGRYQEIWKRQQGRCYYCGRPILPDQARDVVQINMGKSARPSNLAYVHEICKANELSVYDVLGDVSVYTTREMLDASQEIESGNGSEARLKLVGPLRENWPYMPLKRWFAIQQQASITLTFKEVESILKRKLPESAKKYTAKWYTRPDQNAMAEAWVTEGYKLHKLDMDKQKVTFHRNVDGMSHVTLPKWLTLSKIPDAASAELDDYLSYLKRSMEFKGVK